jgi:hypothetical protein
MAFVCQRKCVLFSWRLNVVAGFGPLLLAAALIGARRSLIEEMIRGELERRFVSPTLWPTGWSCWG